MLTVFVCVWSGRSHRLVDDRICGGNKTAAGAGGGHHLEGQCGYTLRKYEPVVVVVAMYNKALGEVWRLLYTC